MAAFERATVGLVLWWSASNAFAANPGSVLSVNRLGVEETAERMEADARSRGLAVVGRADLAGDARRAGWSIRPVRTLSIDAGNGGAPMRFVIWQAPSGATLVSIDERLAETDLAASPLPQLMQTASAGPQTLQPR